MHHLLVVDSGGDLQLVDTEQQVRMPIGEPLSQQRAPKLRPPASVQPRVQAAVWSAAGQWTAWSVGSEDPTGLGELRLHDEDTDTFGVLAEGVSAFCLSPSPSGRYLAHLSSGPLGLELAVSDIVTGDLSIIERGQPLFWSWSPDSSQLAVHVGGRVSIIGIDGSQPHPLTHEAGSFTTPAWLPGGSVVHAIDDSIVCRDIDGVSATLVDHGSLGRFLLDPDGRRIAYIDVSTGEPRLVVADLLTGDLNVVTDRPVGCFIWSPLGQLASLVPVGDRHVQWLVGADNEPVPLEPFRPGTRWARLVLPFFEQFAQSNPCWSYDARRLVAPAIDDEGGAGALIQQVEPPDEPTWVSDAEFAWWA